MLKQLLIIFSITLTLTAFGQTTFEYRLESTINHWPRNIVEQDEEFIINIWQERTSTLLIKIDNNGVLIDSVGFYNPEGICILGNLINADSNYIIGLGTYTLDTLEYLWFVKLNSDLSIIEEKFHYIKDYKGYEVPAIINKDGNIIMATTIEMAFLDFKSCVIELDQNGEIVLYKEYESPGMLQNFYDILEDTINDLYKIFALRTFERSMSIINLDSKFNIDNQSYVWDWEEQNSAKWISQNRYILSAKYQISSTCDMKIIKLTDADEEIGSIVIGEEDMFENPGITKNMDFINPNEIYFAGMKGYTWPEPYLTFPNWLMLCKLDSSLNVEWQRTYGGDANYSLYTVLATSDGGFIMSAGRYDHNIQDEELDVFILKVDSDGLITGLSEATLDNEQAVVFPNPASDCINFKTSLDINNIEIYSLLGQFVMNVKEVHNSINISFLDNGVYFLKIHTTDGVFTQKLVKH